MPLLPPFLSLSQMVVVENVVSSHIVFEYLMTFVHLFCACVACEPTCASWSDFFVFEDNFSRHECK